MNIIRFGLLIFLILLTSNLFPNLIMNENEKRLKIFYSQNDQVGWNAVLKGKVVSFGVRIKPDKDALVDNVKNKSKISVRLYDKSGIDIGSELFVINNKNLIVSRIKISAIYKSRSFGYIIIGYGNFRLAGVGNRVAQRITEHFSKYSFIHKTRGDYYKNLKENGKAISEYKRAIQIDKGNPQAHLALGNIYYKSGIFLLALKEYQKAYKSFSRLYDNEDKYILLRQLADIRYRDAFYSYLPDKLKKKYRKEGIAYSKKGLIIYPDSAELNFFLGMFYYRVNGNGNDKLAKDYFLNVIKTQPHHIEANISLSRLYYKHKNYVKAKNYALTVLKIDKNNIRAKEIMNYLENYNKSMGSARIK